MRLFERALTVGFAISLAACNMLTGADQLSVDDDETDGAGAASGAGDASSANGAGSGGGLTTGSGDSTGAGTTDPLGDATGVSVTEVAFYQAVKSTVFENGAPVTPSVRIVAGRPAVVRVYVAVSGTSGAPITARLYVGSGAPIEQEVTNLATSNDGNIGSTINFDVPAERLTVGATWHVELKEPTASSSGANPDAATPEAGLGASASSQLKVTLIPISYGADGSGRMPNTSPSQVEAYRQLFMKLYPTTGVVVSVGPSMSWNDGVYADGTGWDTLLNAVSDDRTSSAADFDEYYYGVFEPASDVGAYCGGGCVAGLGFIGEPNGEYSRAAIGLGFGGDISTWTAVHEVGHNHGRPHSPCGPVAGADPSFPHAGGAVGVQGMDIFTKELIPATDKDFMGYCDPAWISDYVYEEIFDFIQSTDTQASYIPPQQMNVSYERVSVGPSGERFLSPLTMQRPPMGGTTTVSITDDDGATRAVEGHFYAYDHLEGGVLFVPRDGTKRIHSVDTMLSIAGKTRALQLVR
ncbi:MAG TPA: hypothetical protein VL400_18050 [Polyangiaceae bacterium]|nr:hypothetical protein [Polyangiaceae bacterium]